MYSEQTQNTKYYCLTNTVFQIKIFQIHVQSCPIALDNVDGPNNTNTAYYADFACKKPAKSFFPRELYC